MGQARLKIRPIIDLKSPLLSKRKIENNLEVELMHKGHKRVVELITGVQIMEGAALRGLAGNNAPRSTFT